MAIATLAAYKIAAQFPEQRRHISKAAIASVVGRSYSLWATGADAGAAPTTAVAPTNTTSGALGQINGGASALRLIGADVAAGAPGMVVVCDRLSHQGGLSAIVTGAQTTNLPTAALTRYTSGVGVMLGLEVYTVTGTTATTVTCSYTNQSGSSGQTTPVTVFGGTAFREAGRLLILPLASGDTGVQAVANVNIVATTGTAGNFGVTLFKPLFAMPIPTTEYWTYDPLLTCTANLPDIVDGACLFFVVVPSTTSTGALCANLKFAED